MRASWSRPASVSRKILRRASAGSACWVIRPRRSSGGHFWTTSWCDWPSARARSAAEASSASASAVSSEQDRTGTMMPAASNNGRVCSSIRWLNASLRRPRNEMSSRSVEMSVEAGIALGCFIAVDTSERADLAAFAHDTKAEVAHALDREQVAAERFERQAEAVAPGVKQFASDEVDAPSFVAAGDGLECGRVWVRAFGKLGRPL